MFPLRPASLAFVAIACFGCAVPVPEPPRLTIALKGRTQVPPPPKLVVEVHADAEAQTSAGAEVDVHAQADVQAQGDATTTIEAGIDAPVDGGTTADQRSDVESAYPAHTEPVPLVGAKVVEFFGIPLDGVQDVVFVLDRSGSMEELAMGQIAQLAAPPSAPPLPVDAPVESGESIESFEPPMDAPPEPAALPAASPAASLDPPMEAQAQSPRKIDVAHAELVDALERLPVGTRMNVLFFNTRFEAVVASISPLDDRSRQDAIGFVWQTIPDGATALAPAMRTAYLMNARRIVLLSDGLGNVGGDAAAVMRDAREAMRGGVRIDTIGLGQDQDTWLLRSLASESGGIYQRL